MIKKNLRVMLVTNGLPYQGNNGIPMFCWALIDYLTNSNVDVDVLSLCTVNDKFSKIKNELALKKICNEIKIIKYYENNKKSKIKPNFFNRIFNFLTVTKLQNFYKTLHLKKGIQEYILKSNPDVVIAVHTEALAVTDGLDKNIPVFGIFGDPTYLPFYFNTIESLDIKKPLNSLIKLFVYYRDRSKLIKEDIRLLSNCSIKGALADHYAKWFRKNGLLECEYFRLPVIDDGVLCKINLNQDKPNRKFRIMLLGALHGTATVSGLKIFANKVYPKLIKLIGFDNFEVQILGDGNWPNGIKDITKYENVYKRGYVDDIKNEMNLADILVVPTPINLGIRVRILTALSYGQCIVAHKANAEGIPELSHFKNCFLANSGDEMARVISKLYLNDKLRSDVSKGARNTYLKYFHPNIASEEINKKILSINKIKELNSK